MVIRAVRSDNALSVHENYSNASLIFVSVTMISVLQELLVFSRMWMLLGNNVCSIERIVESFV